RPNDFYNGYQLKFIIIANILLNGEAFVELERNPRNKIENLYHIKNSQIQPKQDESTGFELVYEVFEDQRKRIIHSKDIFHFKFFSLDGISGVAPLKALKSDMDTQESSKRFLNNFFRQGQGSSGILKYKGGKLNKDARDKLKEDWQEANSGVDESHKVVVLDESMDYEPLPIEVNSEILKLVYASNFTSEQVAKVLKIPAHMFGLDSSNMKLQELNDLYLKNTLNPYLKSLTSEIIFKTCDKKTKYTFNTDSFKYIDPQTKTEITKDKISNGIITLNEARRDY